MWLCEQTARPQVFVQNCTSAVVTSERVMPNTRIMTHNVRTGECIYSCYNDRHHPWYAAIPHVIHEENLRPPWQVWPKQAGDRHRMSNPRLYLSDAEYEEEKAILARMSPSKRSINADLLIRKRIERADNDSRWAEKDWKKRMLDQDEISATIRRDTMNERPQAAASSGASSSRPSTTAPQASASSSSSQGRPSAEVTCEPVVGKCCNACPQHEWQHV